MIAITILAIITGILVRNPISLYRKPTLIKIKKEDER